MGQREEWVSGAFPCPCGKGTVSVIVVDYGHGYGACDREGRIDCPDCSTTYEIRAGKRDIRLRPRSGGKDITYPP